MGNNNIYYGPAGFGTAISIQETRPGTHMGHIITNNAIQYMGDNPWNCFNFDMTLASFGNIDYNVCHFPDAATRGQWSTSGTLTDWQTLGYGIYSNSEDPLFEPIDPNKPDLITKHRSSPLVDNGNSLHFSITDKNGVFRDSSPDIGAYELDHDAPDTVE